MKPSILSIPTIELLDVWAELVEAYHGCNKFGGTVAEIYAYRLLRRQPCLELPGYSDSPQGEEWAREVGLESAAVMYQVLRLFAERYAPCLIGVNGRLMGKWLVDEVFDHRWHIEVRRKQARRKAVTP